MSQSGQSDRKPITDSPWFWVYLFATGGLIALVLMGPKFMARQTEIERQAQGRQRAIRTQLGQEATTAMSSPDDTVISLRPLFWTLGSILVVAWSILWWKRFRRPSLGLPEAKPEVDS